MILDNIQELCNLNGITIGQLEKNLGFGFATIRKWDKSNPTIDKLKKVADYFNVSIDELMRD